MSFKSLAAAAALFAGTTSAMAGTTPEAIAAPGRPVMTLHGVGAQIYECKAGADGKLVWQFREPVATLLGTDGSTRGRHYAGPTWELADGNAIVGKLIARSPGATPADIPLFKLEVETRRGKGAFDSVAVIQRLATKGGIAAGACSASGSFLSVPYSADYTFVGR